MAHKPKKPTAPHEQEFYAQYDWCDMCSCFHFNASAPHLAGLADTLSAISENIRKTKNH